MRKIYLYRVLEMM